MSEFEQKKVTNETVILLHGLARTGRSFKKLARILTANNYQVINVTYPSTQETVETLAYEAISQALMQCHENHKIHFVTHSMGGILVRQYLKHHKIEQLGRVVMLGPPNQGSEVVDNLGNLPGFKLINGPAGQQLGTERDGFISSLGQADFELGIIAGSKSINLILSLMLPSPDDGKVSVENTKLEGMKDHITLAVTHPFMMNNSKVIYQILHFLKTGVFQHH